MIGEGTFLSDMKRLTVLFFLLGSLSFAERYALILNPPAPAGNRMAIRAAQTRLKSELSRRDIPVTGSVERVLDAVFVIATPDRVDELKALPGVRYVAPLRRYKMKLNKAVPLVNGPAAWDLLGGVGNAGAGVKIAIVDTGIDQNHPAFQDPSLTPPSGYPVCQGSDCAFTNSKIIVARSYVRQLAAGTPPNPAATSRPDDYSPRDHVGHGTALAMTAAGVTNTGPAATITGMAPKAFLGNYKIFGTADINQGTSSDIIIRAIEDALNDGMNIAVLSLGSPALSGPLDTGAACGMSAGTPCDPQAAAMANAVSQGLTIVAAGGNEGDLGLSVPTMGTIDSPGYTPTVLSVGAVTNAHAFVNGLRVPGSDVPSNLALIAAVFGDGPLPDAPVTAPLRDIAAAGGDATGCTGVAPGSLNGVFALIQRGGCTFLQKVQVAQQAGAVGAVLYQQAGESLFTPGGLASVNIPAVLIGNQEGLALRSFLAANPDHPVTLDPGLVEMSVSTFNQVASFSSVGPAIDGSLKPDLVAVGTNMYMATQSSDPSGPMYNATGYTEQDGTSFSTPMVAGAAALVKQRNASFTPAQVRSALVNTASVDTVTAGNTVLQRGAGELNAASAVTTNITIEPATLSFGIVRSVPVARRLTFRNTGTASATLTLSLAPTTSDTLGQLTLDRNSLTLGAGASGDINVTLGGRQPAPGDYEGSLNVQGGAVPLHVPYLYIVGDGVPANAYPLFGYDVVGAVGQENPDGGIAFRVIDRYGVGVSGVPATWRVTAGGGTVFQPDTTTDQYGIAAAGATFGPQPGAQQFQGSAGGLVVNFDAVARPVPSISANGVVDAASFQPGPIVPGSYVTIFGTGMSDTAATAPGAVLPVSLSGVSVAFDAGTVSVPGHLYYVSPGQVNVQVPWELQGQTSAQMKVDFEGVNGTLVTVPVAPAAPAIFAYDDAGVRSAAALDQNNNLIGASVPARRGSVIQVYMNGLGPVDNQPASGDPAPSQPLARTVTTPSVTIGGRPATVSFSGLAPGFAGLYQVNLTVPPDAPTGFQPIVATVNNVASPPVSLQVQ